MKMRTTSIIVLTIQALFTIMPQHALSQVPEKMSYQSIIRNAMGDLVSESPVGIQISINQDSIGGATVYSETHTVTTNVNGLASLEVGTGTIVSGLFADIDWGVGPYFIKTDVDPSGGVSYSMSATSELLSVPYALFAGDDGDWIETDSTLSSDKLVGMGISNPEAQLDIEGGDWNLEAGNPGDLRIGSLAHNFRIGVATGGGGAGITRMFTNSNALILGVNDSPSIEMETDGSIIAPLLTDSLIDIAGNKSLITKEYAETNYSSTGLESINEGNGFGWRLIGRDSAAYGNVGVSSTDLSYNTFVNNTRGATGNYSFTAGGATTASGHTSTAIGGSTIASGNNSTATGNSTTASGNNSTAMGSNSRASGINSTAIGNFNIASEYASTAMGSFAKATGKYSVAIGHGTDAPSHGEIVVGTWNDTYSPNDSLDFDLEDRLFVIGNGTVLSPSNALVILKNGTVTVPSLDLGEITDAKAIITKEYADVNFASSGLEALNEGSGDGWRLKGRNPSFYGDIGLGAIDFSLSDGISFTQGATGNYSIAAGYLSKSSGQYSVAMGRETIALGIQAVATGFQSRALGSQSTAFGFNTTAQGNYSTSMGFNTTATSSNSTAIGRYNVGGGSTTSWNSDDPLFEIGNGSSTVNTNNAITVLKNGDLGISTATPETKLQITDGDDTGLGNNHGYLLLGETNGLNVSFDNNEIMARNNGAVADLSLQIEGGNLKIGGTVFIGDETIRDAGNNAIRINAALLPDVDNTNVLGNPTQRWTTIYATNGSINTSDRREKKNINEIDYGLAEVLQMQPVSFNWKSKNNPDVKLGLIAQDLQKLVPEVVNSHMWEADEESGDLVKKEQDRLGVFYSDLIPVLIKAIQEQQSTIDEQEAIIDDLLKESKVQADALNANTSLMKELQSIINLQSNK